MDDEFIPRRMLEILFDEVMRDMNQLMEKASTLLDHVTTLESQMQKSIQESVHVIMGAIGSTEAAMMRLQEKALGSTDQQLQTATNAAMTSIKEQSREIVLKAVESAAGDAFSYYAKTMKESTDYFARIVNGYKSNLESISKTIKQFWTKNLVAMFLVCLFSLTTSFMVFRLIESRYPIFQAGARDALNWGREMGRIWPNLKPATQAEIRTLIESE